MRVNPKPLIWRSVTGLLWALSACSDPSPTSACIETDLGRFRFEQAAPQTGGGCQASYRSNTGNQTRVQVSPYRPGMFEAAGNPVSFGKHKVFLRITEQQARVGWFSGQTAVSVQLPGSQKAEGPVVRAYLIRYPSAVTSLLQTVEHDVQVLRKSSHKTPKKAELHLQMARKYEKLGNRVMATQEYHICIDVDARAFPCFLELGQLYFELRHWDLSIRALRKACKLMPGSAEAWLALAKVHKQVKNTKEARAALQEVLRLEPGAEQRSEATRLLSQLTE